jgi:nitrite reductase (NO-forming)
MTTRLAAALLGLALLSLGVPALAGPQDQPVKKFELVAGRRDLVIGEGVVFKAFTFSGTVPGPLIIVEEGDRVEITVRNPDTIMHGLSMHAANTQTALSVGAIPPGQTKRLTFTAEYPGVYMYHCAPGGHGILAHTMGGMLGMVVVEPKKKYKLEEELGRPPDLKIYIVQQEIYANGRDFFDGRALYVMMNGSTFRYVREPIPVRPGDYLRIYYLNAGPNLTATFHAVGAIWNYIYYNGNPENRMTGTQSVVTGPTDSWVIEWKVPAEGPFLFLSHAMGTQAIKGAIGILSSKKDAPRVDTVRSEGNNARPLPEHPKRVVSPFGIGSPDLDTPVRYQPGDTVKIQMVGNSFWPKVVEVPVGTTVTWVNEDVFDLLEGERTGQHNAVSINGPAGFESPSLKHADQFSFTFTKPGEYDYTCTIHPYMRGKVRVYEK